ncbi:pantetheine-phosphate adenylyltransferase [Haloplasma contractile]|uniref:Phosphopantetheine adenylyltransferase n=1 Tax=Haloplasma contractile SSD-17B TaxID=1033810 RepID=U2DYY1_9MOLU|nr:pantetheine-phosphate adenylyltransferase [Haloplasma contractile]ERJ13447.1 Phosphopantetheine adenylyltransferase protein [Haloplasma contractile SSD-17B]
MNKIGVYPGSFDPLTYGHLDIIERGSKLFDQLYIVLSVNSSKKTMFSIDERRNMLERVTKDLDNVNILVCDTLIADFAKELGATALLRGIRAITDFEYELQMAATNRKINPDIDTVCMMTKAEYSYFSSSMVKEIARYKGDISIFVPQFIKELVFEKMHKDQ